jgi:N-acetylglutamate synthase-like GNAT family acetyltransferase
MQNEQGNTIQIQAYSDELAPHFYTINAQWINEMFVLEDIDKQVLENPKKHIINKGGRIWFATHPDYGVVGACALLNKQNACFELTKMGVVPSVRGLKVGEALLQYVIEQSFKMNISTLFLLTNSKCEAAIHLYKKNGFSHDEQIMQRYGKQYERCDVAMRYSKKTNSHQS